MPKKKIFAILGIAYIVTLIIAFMVFFFSIAKAEPTKNRPNSLGVEEVYTNPNVYLFASVAEINVFETKVGRYTNVRFQPYNTMSLYNETVLFCGDRSEELNHRGALIVTYERRAHTMFRGIACHEFDSAFEVPDPEAQ